LGVEVGKKMANSLLDQGSGASNLDASTKALYDYIDENS
jgi:hypothetical protein